MKINTREECCRKFWWLTKMNNQKILCRKAIIFKEETKLCLTIFKLLYCISFIFDLKMHDSNEIYLFCFCSMCFFVNLVWFDWIAFAKKMKSTKINTHIFFCSQSIEFVKNKFPQNPRKTPFAKKKKENSKGQVLLEYSITA